VGKIVRRLDGPAGQVEGEWDSPLLEQWEGVGEDVGVAVVEGENVEALGGRLASPLQSFLEGYDLAVGPQPVELGAEGIDGDVHLMGSPRSDLVVDENSGSLEPRLEDVGCDEGGLGDTANQAHG
jgi:hypothetical protein